MTLILYPCISQGFSRRTESMREGFIYKGNVVKRLAGSDPASPTVTIFQWKDHIQSTEMCFCFQLRKNWELEILIFLQREDYISTDQDMD